MAVVQISRIQNRRGLAENLPQLSSAELGWSIDTQELYIGNGTIDEGAPEVGNTRILTELDLAQNQIYSETVPDGTTANLVYANFTSNTASIFLKYQIIRNVTSGNTAVKTGCMRISYYGSNLSYDDESNETENVMCNIAVTAYGNTVAQVSAVSLANGYDSNVTYTFTTL